MKRLLICLSLLLAFSPAFALPASATEEEPDVIVIDSWDSLEEEEESID